MTGGMLLIVSFFVLVFFYVVYGGFLAKVLKIDDKFKTPAHTMNDGVDYVPAKMPVLLGHHFASIAGAAPIIGPVIAAVFGWVPVFLWLIIGGIFFGAVHDFTSLLASVRNEGKSIGEIIKKYIGKTGAILFLVFTWTALILVIAAFTIIVSKTFVSVPKAASSSVLFIIIAVIFGILTNKFGLKLGKATVLGIVLLIGALYLGNLYPINLNFKTWVYIISAYIFIASVTPVWILLQPRDYLNSFLLYSLLILGFAGMFFYNPQIAAPAFVAFKVKKLGFLFPMLFVTVACGAISGFHSLVASGTTAKQLDNEKDAKPVAYGGMLIETFLGVLALITAIMIGKSEYVSILSSKGPIAVFSSGMSRALAHLPIIKASHESLTAFVSLVVSAFALTSLDTATRLARFAFQELTGIVFKSEKNFLSDKYVATFITVFLGLALSLSGKWKSIWPVFGAANQLLAALSLLAVFVWIYTKFGFKAKFIAIPMSFMFVVTISALVLLINKNLQSKNLILTASSSVLLILSLILIYEAFKVFSKK